MSEILESFYPVVSSQSKILILGSMPGVESLRKQQYYGHKRNQFWKILFSLFDAQWTDSYEERIGFLHNYHIALWDVFRHCEREGSLDQNIRNGKPNDFSSFLTEYQHIESIFCNGTKAYTSFRRNFPALSEQYGCRLLPSTSPAHTMKYEDKLKQWGSIRSAVL